MLNTLLAICTILGGVAAIGYFLEKSPLHLWTRIVERYRRAPAIPITAGSLGAYVHAHARPRSLDAAIATDRGFKVVDSSSDWEWLLERTQCLSIQTILELDQIVRQHFQTARRLSHYMTPQGGVPTAFGVSLALEVEAMSQGGMKGLSELMASLKLTSSSPGSVKETWEAYEQITGTKGP